MSASRKSSKYNNSSDNYKNHENLRIRHENHENYDNPIISCEKHDNTENLENH